MRNVNLRNITNSFLDVRLISLATWRQAAEIMPRDKGGPYVVLQEGFDPRDLTATTSEFVLGRSGKWLALSQFYRLPVPERRAEFVFGTAAEVMQMMSDLPSKVQMLDEAATEAGTSDPPPQGDEMVAALQAGKNQGASPA